MPKRSVLLLIVSSMLILQEGCLLMHAGKKNDKWDALRQASEFTGETIELDSPFDQVIEVARTCLPLVEMDIEDEETRSENIYVFYAEAGPFAFRQGELGRLMIIRESEYKTTLRLYTQKKMASNVNEKIAFHYLEELHLQMLTSIKKSESLNIYQKADPAR